MILDRDRMFFRQDGVPAGDNGTPASGTPAAAPVSAATPAAPPAESSTPSAPAPESTPAPESAGTPAPESGTPPAPGSDVLKTAEASLTELEGSLAGIFGPTRPAPTAGTPSPVAPPIAPVAAPPSDPFTPAAAPAASERITISPEQGAEFYKKYSDATLNDQQSVTMLLEEAANIALSKMTEQIASPKVMDGLLKRVQESGAAQARQTEAVNKIVSTVESFWKKHVPTADPRHLWAFGPYAVRAHPVLPGSTPEQARKAEAQQALFCLREYLAIRGPQSNPANDAVNRGQGAVLPGGGGAPSSGAPAGDTSSPTFQQQLLANRRGERL
jgi:hypothetical protein